MQELLELALEDPERALAEAARLLASGEDARVRSFAHQAIGIVHRDRGRTDEAIAALRLALRCAQRSRDRARESDVRATYAVTIALSGRSRSGLAQFQRALEGTEGELAAKIRMRKGAVLTLLGRHEEAAEEISATLPDILAVGNRTWEARTRSWQAHIELTLGRLDRAETAALAAERLYREMGWTQQALDLVETRAEIAVAKGDLPRGLALFEAVSAQRASEEAHHRFTFVRLYATALLAAGLNAEALALVEDYQRSAEVPAAIMAELHLLHATVLIARQDWEKAALAGDSARTLFRRQGRRWHELRARLHTTRARLASGTRDGVGREMSAVASQLHAEGAPEAALALTLAGRLDKGEDRSSWWRAAAAYTTRANGLVRASAHLAGALDREDSGDRGGTLRACSAGLDALDEHRRLMGSSELRALATTHGRELTEIALRHAAHDPRTLLRWSERTRATALAQPPATSDAATIPASLAALRDNGRRLAEARQAGEPTEDLEKERLRLERAVRTESHTISADSDPQRPASAEEVVAGVGDGCLVELVDVDGCLHVLVVHDGKVRRKVAGTTQDVADLLGPASMLLRRAARGRPADTADIGRRLQEAILGDAVRLVPDGPVVLAPTARLHGLAWSLLPTLHDRPFSVVPSAGQWLRAREVRRPSPRRTLLVAGPELASGGAEVPVLAERHPDAVLLDGPRATVADVLEQLDGADLAHLATHGHFRADSPLFSSLDLADGPLTVYDLERLRKAPYRVVLSACESGVLAPVGAEELLGLAAALFSIGSGGLVSSVAEVNDAATAELMVDLHDALGRGKDPAHALLEVRRSAADDPVAAGTAAAFLALGV